MRFVLKFLIKTCAVSYKIFFISPSPTFIVSDRAAAKLKLEILSFSIKYSRGYFYLKKSWQIYHKLIFIKKYSIIKMENKNFRSVLIKFLQLSAFDFYSIWVNYNELHSN